MFTEKQINEKMKILSVFDFIYCLCISILVVYIESYIYLLLRHVNRIIVTRNANELYFMSRLIHNFIDITIEAHSFSIIISS